MKNSCKQFFCDLNNSLLKRTIVTILLAVPVFFIFVLMAKNGGYYVLDWHRTDIMPPIPIYLGDFSLVFSSRLLLGSVTKLFSEQLTMAQLYSICGIAVLVSLIILSVLCGAVLRKGIENRNFVLIFVTVLLIANPLVAQENFPVYGSYDTYWLILFVVMLFLSRFGCFNMAAPVICLVAVLVHYGFLVSFFPAVLAVLLYGWFCGKKKKDRTLAAVSFWISGFACAGLLFYVLFIANNHLSMDMEEFHEYLLSRLKLSGVEEIRLKNIFGERLLPFDFFEGYFFGNFVDQGTGTNISLLAEAMFSILHNVSVKTYVGYLTAALPLLLMFAVLWATCAKRKKGKEKLPFIVFILIQMFMLVGVIISTDLWRWTSAAMISQFGLLYYVGSVKNDETVNEVLSSAVLKKKWLIAIAVVVGGLYICYLWQFGKHLPKIESDREVLLKLGDASAEIIESSKGR